MVWSFWSTSTILTNQVNDFTKFTKNQVNAKPLSLVHTRWANPSSIPYKPKELKTLVQWNRKKKMYVDDHLMIRWYNDISSLQCFTQRIGNKSTWRLQERENMFLMNFTLRKLLICVFQRFLEVFILCLSLMIVGKL